MNHVCYGFSGPFVESILVLTIISWILLASSLLNGDAEVSANQRRFSDPTVGVSLVSSTLPSTSTGVIGERVRAAFEKLSCCSSVLILPFNRISSE